MHAYCILIVLETSNLRFWHNSTFAGALRATSNAGLQPALDFLFAHTDDPIPDPSTQSSAPQPTTSRTQDDEEDEEELEALRAAMGKANANVAGGSEEGVEAKVIFTIQHASANIYTYLLSMQRSEHQVFSVWQDFQEHGFGKLSCGEEWARSVRRVHRRGSSARVYMCLSRNMCMLITHRSSL